MMRAPRQLDRNIDVWNRDVAENLGYRYTTNAQFSSSLASRRQTDATLALVDFAGKRVIDIGCGDGTFAIELFDLSKPVSIHGVDPAERAIDAARLKIEGRAITFDVVNAYSLPYGDNSFDLAYLRGVLHHMDRPVEALREALRVATTLVAVEPNGYSPLLKVFEKTSSYHREHDEKSYSPAQLDRWVRSLGGEVTGRMWAGLVPMFCADWFARSMKVVEPLVEAIPLLNRTACAVYVFKAERRR